MTRVAIFLLWLAHFLPLPLLALLGRGLGLLIYAFVGERRHVTLTNLRLCFPEWDENRRKRAARLHFQAFGRAFVEHGMLWWSSKERLHRLIRVEGVEHWQAVADRPVIWLAPHFVGLDMGGTRIITEWQGVSVYSHQNDPVLDRILLRGRTRFVTPVLFSRQDGIRPVVRAVRRGLPLYYLPDMDLGSRDSIFVPFFGVAAATVTGLARIAQLAGAVVVPAVTRQLPGGMGYVLKFYPAWTDFPTDNLAADVRRMNAFIEERVREMPEQYFWLHKRFKSRPPGEDKFY
jgi:KDO2-lipid IV(A) lauroyltransferase